MKKKNSIFRLLEFYMDNREIPPPKKKNNNKVLTYVQFIENI